MSATVALLLVLVGWLAIGVGSGLGMGYRGHDPFGWLLLGLLLGPLVVPVALASRRQPAPAGPRQLAAGRQGGGRVDVLVGIDGSPEAAAALDAAVDLLRSRLGRLTLAAVTDLDATIAQEQEEARLGRELRRQGGRIQARLDALGVPAAAGLVLLAGPPTHALTAYGLPAAMGCWWSAPGVPGSATACWEVSPGRWRPAHSCRCCWLAGGPAPCRRSAPTSTPTRPASHASPSRPGPRPDGHA